MQAKKWGNREVKWNKSGRKWVLEYRTKKYAFKLLLLLLLLLVLAISFKESRSVGPPCRQSVIQSVARRDIHLDSHSLAQSAAHSLIQSLQREPFCLTAPLLVAHFGLTWLMFAAEPWAERQANTAAHRHSHSHSHPKEPSSTCQHSDWRRGPRPTPQKGRAAEGKAEERHWKLSRWKPV